MKTSISLIFLIIIAILLFPTRESYQGHFLFEGINGETIEVEFDASRKIRYDIIDHVLSFGGGDPKIKLMSDFCSDFSGIFHPLLLDFKDRTAFLITHDLVKSNFSFFTCEENGVWQKIDKSEFPLELSIPNKVVRRNKASDLNEFIYGTGIITIELWQHLAADTYFKDTESDAEKFLDAVLRYNQEAFPPGKGVIFESENNIYKQMKSEF